MLPWYLWILGFLAFGIRNSAKTATPQNLGNDYTWNFFAVERDLIKYGREKIEVLKATNRPVSMLFTQNTRKTARHATVAVILKVNN